MLAHLHLILLAINCVLLCSVLLSSYCNHLFHYFGCINCAAGSRYLFLSLECDSKIMNNLRLASHDSIEGF